MKFAALALLAVVLFSDDVEARRRRRRGGGGSRGGSNVVKATCTIVPDDADASTGDFKLYQGSKDDVAKPISLHGSFTFAAEDSEENWSIALYDDDSCAGT